MRGPITLLPSNCKMDADFSFPAVSNVTPCPRSRNTTASNGHISLAECPAVPICQRASKPPSSPTCAPRRLQTTNLSSCLPRRSLDRGGSEVEGSLTKESWSVQVLNDVVWQRIGIDEKFVTPITDSL